jgi:hypothetical protein
MDISVLEPSRWEFIFTLLSLDGVVPLYEAMGLQLPDKQRFLKMLRSFLMEKRENQKEGKAQDPPLSTQVVQQLEAFFGRETAVHFYNWATTVFYWTHRHQPQWSAWDIIFLYADSLCEQLSLPPEKQKAISQFRESKNVDDVEQLIARLKTQPLSEWDSEIYMLKNFDNRDDPMLEYDFIDPYSIVLSTVEMNRFQLRWETFQEQFSQDEKVRLWSYGKRMLTEKEIEMPETLLHPDNLHRLL